MCQTGSRDIRAVFEFGASIRNGRLRSERRTEAAARHLRFELQGAFWGKQGFSVRSGAHL